MPSDGDERDDEADYSAAGDDGADYSAAGDDEADYSAAGDDEALRALTVDVGTMLAGRTVVPAAIMMWRTRRQRRADKEAATSAGEGTRPPRWFEI